MPHCSRAIQLAVRPSGEPRPDDFRLVEVEVPDPDDGEVVVRNRWLSVDPYMRGRMDEGESYVPPFALGQPLDGGAVGEVIASGAPDMSVGQWVVHEFGWREVALVPADQAQPIDTDLAPPAAYLGALGATGFTAYVGLFEIADLQPGQVVFVSAAAGAVGSIAGQLAKLHGCRVVGSAGSTAKVAYLRDELGFDAAFNYRNGPVTELLRQAAPDGIDLYYDNVGGDHLEAALYVLRRYGRVVMCGSISTYNDAEPQPGPRNMFQAVTNRLTLRGFIVDDHMERMAEFHQQMAGWLREDKIRYRETVVVGLEHAPDAFIGLFHGDNLGKTVVKLR